MIQEKVYNVNTDITSNQSIFLGILIHMEQKQCKKLNNVS